MDGLTTLIYLLIPMWPIIIIVAGVSIIIGNTWVYFRRNDV